MWTLFPPCVYPVLCSSFVILGIPISADVFENDGEVDGEGREEEKCPFLIVKVF